jgi:hypothetical protein
MALDMPVTDIPRDRLQKHRQRKHATDRDAAEQAAGRDDNPAIVRIGHFRSPTQFSRGKTNGMGRNRQFDERTGLFFLAGRPVRCDHG